MKNVKSVRALVLAVLMILCAACMAACSKPAQDDQPTPTLSATAPYRVSVTDPAGTPYTANVAVRFLKDGKQIAMELVNENGVAEKTLDRGNYTVEAVFTDTEHTYLTDLSDATLTAEKTEATVKAYFGLDETLTRSMNVPNEGASEEDMNSRQVEACFITTGSTQIPLNNEGRNYFLYSPTEPGLYEFSIFGTEAAIGYYGASHFVQSSSAVEVVDNKFQLSIRATMISPDPVNGSVLVIGVDATEDKEAVLSIRRIGEPLWSVENEPWTVYQPTATLKPYTLPSGAALKDFDLKAADYTLVLNENDGYYHLNTADGPLVLVRLGKTTTPSKYVDCYETILENSGVTVHFFHDPSAGLTEENFIKKVDYTSCLMSYIENVDEKSGTYPLTEDLKLIIQQAGEYSGWYNPEHPFYLFVNEAGEALSGINNEISWLFMCCYIAE